MERAAIGWRAALAVAMAVGAGAGHAGAMLPEVALDIVLTPKAAETLQARHEAMVLLVDYYGWPKKGAEKHGDEVGRIDLESDQEVTIDGRSGRYRIPAESPDLQRLGWVEGPVYVNVNVVSARQSSEDNLLNCDFIDAPLQQVAAAAPTLHCGLIEGDPDSPD